MLYQQALLTHYKSDEKQKIGNSTHFLGGKGEINFLHEENLFDVEFSIYRELSKAFFDMVKDATIMIPIGLATYPADKKERDEYEHQLYVNTQKSMVVAQDKLNGEIPFIPELS